MGVNGTKWAEKPRTIITKVNNHFRLMSLSAKKILEKQKKEIEM